MSEKEVFGWCEYTVLCVAVRHSDKHVTLMRNRAEYDTHIALLAETQDKSRMAKVTSSTYLKLGCSGSVVAAINEALGTISSSEPKVTETVEEKASEEPQFDYRPSDHPISVKKEPETPKDDNDLSLDDFKL